MMDFVAPSGYQVFVAHPAPPRIHDQHVALVRVRCVRIIFRESLIRA